MRQAHAIALCVTAALVAPLAPAFGQESEPQANNDVAKANNPLAAGVYINNYYTSSIYGGGSANALLLQGIGAFGLGLQQVARVTIPLVTLPDPAGGQQSSGLGDVNLFDLILVTPKDAALRAGVGPLATFPTANSPSFLGTGKWQVGVASAASWNAAPGVILGAIVTWQVSVAGVSSRANTDTLVFRPIGIFKVGSGGLYLRSSANWIFAPLAGSYTVPFGVGLGTLVRVDRSVINIFIEPQFTALHRGQGQPEVQFLTGINWQYF